MPAVREPARAGTFYAGQPEALRRQVESCFLHELGPGGLPTVVPGPTTRVIGLVVPHAGLMYSGPAAAWAYGELARDGTPELVVLVGPNHTGMGAPAAVSDAEAWRTPLGTVPVARSEAEQLARYGYQVDELAHRFEHALEVQLPFLQFLYGDRVPPVLPVVLGMSGESMVRSARAMRLERLAEGLEALTVDRNVVMLATSDLSHYVSASQAHAKDMLATSEIVALQADRLLEVVDEQQITMCGALPVALVIRALSGEAHSAALLTYYNSGDISGDHDQVVGYAAVALYAQAGER